MKINSGNISAFAVGALPICVLAFALTAAAEVVYTPVNVTISGTGDIKTNLNHDGITDFVLHSASQGTVCGTLGRYALLGSTKITSTTGDGVRISHLNIAAVLPSGIAIDASPLFYNAPAVVTRFFLCYGHSDHVAGYLGLEFQINRQTHYGWAQVDIYAYYNWRGRGVRTTLIGFAYETIPGQAIKTGQTSGSMSETGGIPESIHPIDSGGGLPIAPVSTAAQEDKPKHSHYRLIDLGTFGGPNSYVSFTPIPMNSAGTVVGVGETTAPDPFSPFCFVENCLLVHTFQWRKGVLTDLGGLTGGFSGNPNGINAAGVVTGISENGLIDPLSESPEFDAVVWEHDQIVDLGTFGGTFSYANAINDRSQVVGFALNGASDPFFMDECGAGPMPSQMRAFIWQEGAGLRDLGTLGGPDSCALWINQRGEVAGHSFTSSTPDPATGIPAFHPFLWKNGTMTDLGGLGGTQGHASALNNRGQIAGDSNLAGDQTQHAFLWDHGKMYDLTPGRPFSFAHGLNDKGEVVGGLSEDGLSLKGFFWRRGVLSDLESVPGDECDSSASSINSKSQIVGISFPCTGEGHAAIWENGGPAIDLNTLLRPSSNLQLTEAQFINERGEITGRAVLPDGSEHAFLLVPKDDDDAASATAATQADVTPLAPSPTTTTPSRLKHGMLAELRARFVHRNRGFETKPQK